MKNTTFSRIAIHSVQFDNDLSKTQLEIISRHHHILYYAISWAHMAKLIIFIYAFVLFPREKNTFVNDMALFFD